jgi:uroporphyrinogen-III synthase
LNHLKGARILVTRPAHQSEKLCRLLVQCGGTPIRLPALEIIAADNRGHIQAVLAHLKQFQWLVFISANAVNFALKAINGKIDQFANARIAAIGR